MHRDWARICGTLLNLTLKSPKHYVGVNGTHNQKEKKVVEIPRRFGIRTLGLGFEGKAQLFYRGIYLGQRLLVDEEIVGLSFDGPNEGSFAVFGSGR